MINILGSALIILIMGFLSGEIFKKLKLPSLIGMIIAGIFLGPYQLNYLGSEFLSLSRNIRQIALVIILLRAGISLEISDFKNTKTATLMMSFIPAIFEIIAITLGAIWILSFSWIDALLLATVIAAVSPAVIVPKMIKVMDEGYGQVKKIPQLILAAASLDDVLVLVLFSVALSLGQANNFEWLSLVEIPLSIFLAIGVSVIIGKVISFVMKRIHWIVQLIVIFVVSFVFFEIEAILPFSALVAIMSFAMSLRYFCPQEAVVLKGKISKIWIVAEIFLFGLVGAAVNLSVLQIVGLGSILLLTIGLIWRSVGVYLSVKSLPWNSKEKLFCVISYWPKATVQAAIGSIPLAMGVIRSDLILAISVLAILITAPLGALAIERTYTTWLEK